MVIMGTTILDKHHMYVYMYIFRLYTYKDTHTFIFIDLDIDFFDLYNIHLHKTTYILDIMGT